jgi:hypothetical protein
LTSFSAFGVWISKINFFQFSKKSSLPNPNLTSRVELCNHNQKAIHSISLFLYQMNFAGFFALLSTCYGLNYETAQTRRKFLTSPVVNSSSCACMRNYVHAHKHTKTHSFYFKRPPHTVNKLSPFNLSGGLKCKVVKLLCMMLARFFCYGMMVYLHFIPFSHEETSLLHSSTPLSAIIRGRARFELKDIAVELNAF